MTTKTQDSLLVLDAYGPLTCAAFSAHTGISYHAARSRLRILEEKGYIKRKDTKASQKLREGGRGQFAKYVYAMTPKGRRLAKASASLD